MNTTTYVTTTIPYVNGRPHVGFALELVQADVIARNSRLLGNSTRFQTGTDENAFKNVITAREEGITTQELADRNSAAFRNLGDALTVASDSFVRTTDDRHRRGVHQFWHRVRSDDLYRKRYTGLYCVGCEDFYLERDLVDGRCPDHGTTPVPVEETNYFFRLSSYQGQLEELLSSDAIRVIPESRKNEVLSFIRRGLQDISVSRAAERSGGWGIPVPGDPSQTIYVWIDALINYVSGLGFGRKPNWDDFWNEDTRKIHVIGKNVWKFHAIYWPALLLSAGLALPDEIVVHGFLTENGQKISKSRGSTIDPFTVIAEHGADSVRYYLLRAVSPFLDGDFSVERLAALYVSDLANGLGNLVSRLTTLSERASYGAFDCPERPDSPAGFRDAINEYRFDDSLRTLWNRITQLNQGIDQAQPWVLLREAKARELRDCLTQWLEELHSVAYWLQPFLPGTADRILAILAAERIRKCAPLFPK